MPLNQLFEEVREKFVKRYPNLEKNLQKNFGFGTGFEFREKPLLISKKNTNRIARGNVFCVVSGLKDLENEKNFKYSMHLSDTVILTHQNKVKNLTGEIKFGFEDIGYDIQEEEDAPRNDYSLPKQQAIDYNAPRQTRAQKRRA